VVIGTLPILVMVDGFTLVNFVLLIDLK